MLPVYLQGGFDFSDLFGGLIGILQSVFNALVQFFVFLFQILEAVIVFIYNLLVAGIRFLIAGFRILLRGLQHVISDIIHGRFAHLFADYLKLVERLRKIFAPIIHIIEIIRNGIRKFFDLFIAPIIDLIQKIRQILVIFRIFHLRFAERLDEFLANLQRVIIENFRLVLRTVNQILNTLDILADPSLVIRRNVLGATLLSWLGAVKRIVRFGHNRALRLSEQEHQDQDKGTLQPGAMLIERRSGGGIDVAPAVQRIFEGQDAALAYYQAPKVG